ncbi:MAG: hypothetical protein VW832_04505 [bacterium]|tara:strand:+ start:440 stop:673 length:234 start_codon:yes stop_codon:yes gene_type:complete
MNEENRKIAWSYITKIGDEMKGKLPESPNHPKGRNPYAHILILIKTKFGCSYREIPDEKLSTLIRFVDFVKERSILK